MRRSARAILGFIPLQFGGLSQALSRSLPLPNFVASTISADIAPGAGTPHRQAANARWAGPVGRFRRRGVVLFLLIGQPWPVLPGAERDTINVVGTATTEWVKTRLETARLETEWRTQRPLLESTVNGLAERAQTLETKRDYVLAKTASEREELARLEAASQAATAGLLAVDERAKAMSGRLLQLRRALPPRLSEALEMSYRSLAATGLSTGERMLLNMTVLNRCGQFNRSITCEKEILELGEGKNARLYEVVYWGLSHGYALDRSSGQAWLGSPGPSGWQWELRPDSAKPLARLIAIYQGQADPEFVSLPARVGHLPPARPAK